MGKNTSSSIRLPQSVSLTIQCTSIPQGSQFTRYLSFRDFNDNELSLMIKLTKTAPLVLEATDFPETTHNLQVLGSLNHRSYWDRIYLENKGGDSHIRIGTMSLTVHYPFLGSEYVSDIPLLDNTSINRNLAAGESKILLTPFIENHLVNYTGLNSGEHKAALLAVKDLGKSGTSDTGYDEFRDNPKYRGEINNECSEFASWYLHESKMSFPVPIQGLPGIPRHINSFKDCTYSNEIHDIFKSLGRSYRYHSGLKKWVKEGNDQVQYTPKAGDYLVRRAEVDGKQTGEHSMIMLKWDPANRIATVINGPYPVTLREVRIHDDEVNRNKDFVVGSVWD